MRIAVGRGREIALVVAGGVLTGASVLASAGSSDDRLLWIGGAAIVVAGLACAAAATGFLRLPLLGLAARLFVALLCALVVWCGLSIVWSIAPDLSWAYFNRGLAYLAFLAIGLLLAANVVRPARLTAIALAAFTGGAAAWGIASKMAPGIAPGNDRIARLHTPIGYWNALALLFAMGLPAALWLASRREHGHVLRTVGVLLVYGSATAVLMTYSRGGVLVWLVVAALFILLVPPRLDSVAALALGGVPGAAVALWSFTRAGLSTDLQPHAARVRDGEWFALVFLLVGVLVAAGAFWASRYEARRPLSASLRLWLRRGTWAALAAGVAGLAIWLGFTAHPNHWLNEFTKGPTYDVTTPGRLATISSTSRWQWWTESWHAFENRPWLGSGAASFVLVDHILRPRNTYVTEPHSLPVQFVGETGIFGLFLFLGATAAAIVAVVRRLRAIGGDERAPAIALALAALAYLLHALIDFDWDFVAVTGPLMLALGVLIASPGVQRARAVRLGRVWAFGSLAIAAFAVYSLAAPWLSRRDTNEALAQIDANHAKAAVASARRAHDLDPVALEPLFAWGLAEEERDNDRTARRVYVRAVEIQPLNWRSWYELGNFEFIHGRLRVALVYLDTATSLDPHGGEARSLRDYVKKQLAGG
jgi:hypothetical protein